MNDDKGTVNDKGAKTATATNPTVGADLALLRQENSELRVKNDKITKDLETVKKQLDEANTVIERELRETLYTRITGKSNYTREELDPRTVEELQKLDADLSRGLGAASQSSKTGRFNKIVSAGDSVAQGTMPELYGKDRATILKELRDM
jgi:hypothetical protein